MKSKYGNRGNNRFRNGRRRRNAERGAETSGGSWRVGSVGDVQWDSTLRLGTEICINKEQLMMWEAVGRKRE